MLVNFYSHSDGRPHYRRQSESKSSIQKNAQLNKETNPFVQVPRTHRNSENFRPPNQSELMSVLIPKLEAIRRSQESKERFDQKMMNDDANSVDGSRAVGCNSGGAGSITGGGPVTHHGQAFTDAIFRKLQVDDDNDQSILDQHVSRVWSDLTPHRSPGTVSPCPDALRRRTHDDIAFGIYI